VSERRDRGGWSTGRQPAEGVRIIRAEEAQAALDAGEAAGRRPEDELRFGDVPPVPEGPRPAHRFPLPDSVDPAEAVALRPVTPAIRPAGERPPPPLAGPGSGSAASGPESAGSGSAASGPGSAGSGSAASGASGSDDRTAQPGAWGLPPGGWDIGDRTAEMGVPEASNEPEDPTGEPGGPASFELPEEGLTVSGGGTELPHWTDPPTGEVPRILVDEGEEPTGDDDLDAWRALGSKSIRWRDAEDDWDEVDEMGDLAGDEEPLGVLDQNRAAQSDLYSFDEEFERVTSRTGGNPVVSDHQEDTAAEQAADQDLRPPAAPGRHGRGTTRVESRSHAATPGRGGARPKGTDTWGGDGMTSRVLVGAALVVLLLICYAIGSKALVVLSAVVIVAAVAEAYRMLQRAGFRPATLLGLIATAGVVFGAYWRGVEALPLMTVLLFAGSMMWYVLGIVEARPLANVAVTVMVFVWVGLLGSYGSLMLAVHQGKGLFLGAIVVAVAADIAAFLVGRTIGSRPMAQSVSPHKTIEGFIGGLVGALIVGAIVGKELAPWHGTKHGLVLGLVIGLIAPMGDLFESMIKRDLGVKDSGNILPGHGGLLDRFDSILLALPAAYYVAILFKL
jgi:phosphatidate cytidylyltransferase